MGRYRSNEQITSDLTEQTKYCTGCSSRKSFDEFGFNSSSADGMAYRCKVCVNARNKARRHANPYVHRNNVRGKQMEKTYGVDTEWYIDKLIEQEGKCAICGTRENQVTGVRSSYSFVIDHNHETGAVRGLLCRKCNAAIGALGDSAASVQKAVDYLKMY